MNRVPSLDDIRSAHLRILPYINRTPVLTSGQLNRIYGCSLFFKCENFQKTGSFKFRGAVNAVLQLNEEQKKGGVVTHSSGNHAAALSLAARMNGIGAYIVMPETSPDVKKKAVAGYGAGITFCKPGQAQREAACRELMNEKKATLIHPYDNFNVICGQGTVSLELLEEVKDLDVVVAPVGGGGLLGGTSCCVKGTDGRIRVLGAEPVNANDAWKSFKTGKLTPSVNPLTIADGLLTSLSELTFNIIRNHSDDIITVSEKSIIESMKLIWERMKIIAEPSSATVLAAVGENPGQFRGKRIGLIISGGNVDLTRLPF